MVKKAKGKPSSSPSSMTSSPSSPPPTASWISATPPADGPRSPSNRVLNFLRVFKEVIGQGLKMSAEEIEMALIEANGDVALIHTSLLKFDVLKNLGDITAETMLLLWSMRERYKNDSRFKIYFETSPKEFRTGIRKKCNLMLTNL